MPKRHSPRSRQHVVCRVMGASVTRTAGLEQLGQEIVYLVQGSRENLDSLELGGRPVITLCYEGEHQARGATVCLHSTTASWAEGRNLMLEAALRAYPSALYYVFCDDDVQFVQGSYGDFEDNLRATRPLVGFPLMPKGKMNASWRPDLRVQRAVAIDEQMYAVHRDLIGTVGIAPLDTLHDDKSWFSPAITFEYMVAKLHGEFAHQYNDVEILNEGHVWLSGEGAYAASRGDHTVFLPLCFDRLRELTGDFDPHVIEQFDFGSSPQEREVLNQQLRDEAGTWKSWSQPARMGEATLARGN